MGDQLEKFLMDNRETFDSEVPSEKVWNQIDQKLASKRNMWPTVWKVAAMLFMATTILLIIDRPVIEEETFVMTEEFNQAEDYYISMINEKRVIIEETLTPEQQEQFLAEIDQLDTMYDELKKTYQTNSSNERVMDAMISNLQLRLEIMNRQLELLESIKNQNDENDTSIEI